MKSSLLILSALSISFFQTVTPALAEDACWENHYSKAEKAYARHDLFEARREFLIAWKEAQEKKQDAELARRVEDLAGAYQSNDNKQALAQPLFKLARKLRSKLSCT